MACRRSRAAPAPAPAAAVAGSCTQQGVACLSQPNSKLQPESLVVRVQIGAFTTLEISDADSYFYAVDVVTGRRAVRLAADVLHARLPQMIPMAEDRVIHQNSFPELQLLRITLTINFFRSPSYASGGCGCPRTQDEYAAGRSGWHYSYFWLVSPFSAD